MDTKIISLIAVGVLCILLKSRTFPATQFERILQKLSVMLHFFVLMTQGYLINQMVTFCLGSLYVNVVVKVVRTGLCITIQSLFGFSVLGWISQSMVRSGRSLSSGFHSSRYLIIWSFYFTLPGGQAHKRRRTSEPIEIEDRLESLICRVGEKVKRKLRRA